MLISNGKYPCSILELLIESPLNLEADVENRWFRRMKIQVEAADVQLLHQHSPSCFDRTGRDQSHPGFHLRLTSESVERKGETKKQRDILASEEVQRDIASPRHYDLWSLCTGPKGPCRWHLEKNAKSIGVDHRITLLCAEQLLNTGKIWQISAMIHIWLVVSTILKNMRQWEGLSRVLWNIKNVLKPPTRYRSPGCHSACHVLPRATLQPPRHLKFGVKFCSNLIGTYDQPGLTGQLPTPLEL